MRLEAKFGALRGRSVAFPRRSLERLALVMQAR